MNRTWTDEAKEYFEGAMVAIARRHSEQGEDGADVAQSVRLHVEEELAGSAVGVVTLGVARGLLVRIFGYDPLPEENAVGEAVRKRLERMRGEDSALGRLRRGSLWGGGFVFGVLLPLVALGVELVTGVCADGMFDPVATWAHAALIAWVPINYAYLMYCAWRGKKLGRWHFAGLGLGIGVSIVYAGVFMPLTPFAAILIIAYGLGFLPLAPLLALLAQALVARRLLRESEVVMRPGRTLAWGVVAGVAALVALELPLLYTHSRMADAVSTDDEVSVSAIQSLRRFGSRATMAQACLPDFERGFVGGWRGSPIGSEQAAKVYYQVTGESVDEYFEREGEGRARLDTLRLRNRWDWYQGEQAVGRKVEGLSLAASRMDGEFDTRTGIGYLEWTMSLRNDSMRQGEARMLMRLPPGSVVSRATLWVDGEEREAAYTSRARAVEAYRKVVRSRRDPLLVTGNSFEEAMVQCFPIAPRGGEMRIRIGVTFEADWAEAGQWHFALPSIESKNFEIEDGLETELWFEANAPLVCNAIAGEGLSARGAVAQRDLVDGPISFRAERMGGAGEMYWSPDTFGDGVVVVSENAASEFAGGPWVVVLDGSLGNWELKEELLDTLRASGLKIEKVLVAADRLAVYGEQDLDGLVWNNEGGQDNAAALVRAMELRDGNEGANRILWIHGDQRVRFGDRTELERALTRKAWKGRLVTFQYEGGPNALLTEVSRLVEVETAPRFGYAVDDFERLLRGLVGGARRGGLAFKRMESPPEGGIKVAGHAVRLWALAEAKALRYARRVDGYALSGGLAARYQLVTPASGAVVLETKEQFAAAGLEAAEKKSVQSIPDTGATALLLLVGLLVVGVGRRWIRGGRGE